MQRLTSYIQEARKPGFDTSWFGSKECYDLYNKTQDSMENKAYQIYLLIDNTRELWERYQALMKSAVKHSDFDPEICATSSTMAKIVLDGIKKYNSQVDYEDRLGRVSADFKKSVGLLLVTSWEE